MTPTKPADEKKTGASEGGKPADDKAGSVAAGTTAAASTTAAAGATAAASGATAAAGTTGTAAVPMRKPGRRAPGAKEVIPFAWKLIGTSADLTVTLFKAIEKVDVEAQLERLRRDGYYKNLEVLDVDAVVVQRVPAKKSARPKSVPAKAVASAKASASAAPAKKKISAGKSAATSKTKSAAKKALSAPDEPKSKKKPKTGSATKKKR